MSFCRLLGALTAPLLLIYSLPVFADYTLNMTQGVTPVSEKIYNLHMIILSVCTVIGIGVYGVMIWAIVRHRKSKNVTAATFHESTVVEVIWTIIPFLILLVMAAPATYTLIFMEDTSEPDISVKVTGYRWYWRYDYLDDDVGFYSYLSTPEAEVQNIAPKNEQYLLEVDKPVVLPVGKKIRFLLTSNDVIHAWWVPQLGLKKDCIPGFINESWTVINEPGTYRGQCAELCGVKHGYMPIVVEALSEEDYNAWLAEQKQAVLGTTHNMM